jgi:hypothetical protein
VSRPSGRGRVSGPLGEYGEGFREWLLDRGYTWGSAAHQVRVMAFASRWLQVRGLGPRDLAPAAAVELAAARRAQGSACYCSTRAFAPMLEYLDGLGVLAAASPTTPTAVERITQRYLEYLGNERGLVASSRRSYGRIARRFLDEVGVGDDDVAPRDTGALDRVTAAAVTRFMRRECEGGGRASAKATATALRSLLRYLYLHGHLARACLRSHRVQVRMAARTRPPR